MQENNLEKRSVRDRSRSPSERNTGKRQVDQNNPENETITEVQELLGA